MRNAYLMGAALIALLPIAAQAQPKTVSKQVYQLHQKLITLDSHLDTPASLDLPDWSIDRLRRRGTVWRLAHDDSLGARPPLLHRIAPIRPSRWAQPNSLIRHCPLSITRRTVEDSFCPEKETSTGTVAVPASSSTFAVPTV